MMAGNVVADVDSAGWLSITGDSKGNHIVVEQVNGYQDKYRVTGKSLDGSATTINGRTSQVFSGVVFNINIRGNAGNDKIEVLGTASDKVNLLGRSNLTVHGGEGNDTIIMKHVSSTNAIYIYGQLGQDTITMEDSSARNLISISGGEDRDNIRVIRSTSLKDVTIDSGASTGTPGTVGDKVHLDGVTAGYWSHASGFENGTLLLKGSNANDDFRVYNSKTDFFKAYMNDGNDTLELRNHAVDNDWLYNGGGGVDTLIGSTATASKRPYFENVVV